MKKIVILMFVTASMITASFAVPQLFEKTLTEAEVSVISNIVYTECVYANGEVDKADNSFLINAVVSEDDICNVKIGQKAVITGKGFGGHQYNGTVHSISDTARKQNHGSSEKTVVDIQLIVDNPDQNMRKGNTAEIEIFTSDEKNIFIIPYEAVYQEDDGTEYVYIYSDGIAVRKNIKTGLELSDGIEVISGISDNDQILISDTNIQNGNYIKVVK